MTSKSDLVPLFNTPRLSIRPFIPADSAALFGILGDPQVMRFSIGGVHRQVVDTIGWIEHAARHQARHGFAMSAVLSRDSGEVIGQCGLEVLADGRTEIGYRMRRDKWGQDYATEAARAWLDHGFGALGLRRVVAMIEEANRASLGVAKKIGMQEGASELFHDVSVIAYFANSGAAEDLG